MRKWTSIFFLAILGSLLSPVSSRRFWKGIFGVRKGQLPSQKIADTTAPVRGGGREHKNATLIEEYVAAVEERDARDRQENSLDEPKEDDEWDDNNESGDGEMPGQNDAGKLSNNNDAEGETVSVGVKAHKKSGSVGDADSDDDDDDDDDTDTDSDWEEFEDDIDHMMGSSTQLEVEVEFVEDEDHSHDSSASLSDQNMSKTINSGGVGVILNQRNNRRNGNAASVSTATFAHSPVKEQQMTEAWLPHLYFPPSRKAMDYLFQNARMIDGASKSRLDRRTLYACLLLEWLNANATYRKFFEKSTSQALQAALSLATQPQWRKCSSQRLCGIRLYDSDAERGCTLAMQETIIMALVSRS